MVIYLDQYRIADSAHRQLKNGTYGDDIMTMHNQSKIIRLPQQPATAIAGLPEDLTTADVDTLLDRVYALATQI
jgi:hypothetical protein